ncbi:MAG: hypothetical protein N2Z21_08800 [Candidatus Sumerlaeaceae bacterium]|nr:hypothetical protein [Candidatus Sumerlaeaceae bacterium]
MTRTPEHHQWEAGKESPNPGAAAILAFADIFLCGYLLYFAVYLILFAGFMAVRDVGPLISILLPALLAIVAYCPTDSLTRALGQAARVAGIFALSAVGVRGAIELSRAYSLQQGISFLRAGSVALICSYVSAFALAEPVSALVSGRRLRWLPCDKPPLWLGILYIVVSTCIAYTVVIFSYDGFFYGPRGVGVTWLAIRATRHTFWLTAEVILLFLLVATIPYVLRGAYLASSARRNLPTAVAFVVALSWTVLGAHWGTLAPGFECLVYIVGICWFFCTMWPRLMPGLRRQSA